VQPLWKKKLEQFHITGRAYTKFDLFFLKIIFRQIGLAQDQP